MVEGNPQMVKGNGIQPGNAPSQKSHLIILHFETIPAVDDPRCAFHEISSGQSFPEKYQGIECFNSK